MMLNKECLSLMGTYTDYMNNQISEISPEDDDYTEELLRVAQGFRSFGEALDAFLVRHGFDADNIQDIEEKIRFIKDRFASAGIEPLPRNLRKWFTEKKRLSKRRTAFQFCFAFGLDVEESAEFFRTVCLQRGFDCHSIEEAVYYYAIVHKLSYPEAEKLLAQAPDDAKGAIDFDGDVLFTDSIVRELGRFSSPDEMLSFFRENIGQFGYNNATAYRYIRELWRKIEGENGLAAREWAREKSSADNGGKHSVWDIYLQILGLRGADDDGSPLYVLDTDRSLKQILKDNALLHPLAEESFPDRQGLEAILRGEHKSNELVRKMLILLVFYYFWALPAVCAEQTPYRAKEREGARCHAQMDRFLVDAGYPPLYAGNPYDWIFLFAAQDDYPLDALRYFMRELYVYKKESL